MQFPAEMICQSPVIVVNAEVGGANLAHPQLLLLVAARRHRVAVLLLRLQLLFPQIVNLKRH